MKVSQITAVVTGAASGMGRAYALQLARRGCRLALCDVDEEGLEQTAQQAQAQAQAQALSSAAVMTQTVDVSKITQMRKFADAVKAQLGNAQLVINNAGIEGSTRPAWDTSNAELEKVMGVNFYGVVNGTQAFLPQLVASDEAAVVNVSSIFGLVGTPSNSDYCASKFAVRGYTEALMVELQEVHPHVQVHLLHPGGIDTNITRKPNSQAFGRDFLTTPSEDIVAHVIRAVENNQRRIIYGNQAKKTYWGSRLLPFEWSLDMIGRELKNYKNPDDYSPEHKAFKQ